MAPTLSRNCAVTFNATGLNYLIVVEPKNSSGNFEEAFLAPHKATKTVYFYPDDYTITVYSSDGYEKDFRVRFYRKDSGLRATSATITVEHQIVQNAHRISLTVTSMYHDRQPLFLPAQLQANTVEELSGDPPSVNRNSTDLRDRDFPETGRQFGCIDLLFVVDATVGHGDFLAKTKLTLTYCTKFLTEGFKKDRVRAGLVVTHDYIDNGLQCQTYDFMRDVSQFLKAVEGITEQGGPNGFSAFNLGMKEALGPHVTWRHGARKVVVVLNAGFPHCLGGDRHSFDNANLDIVSLSDPIRMARRMKLMGFQLVLLTEEKCIQSVDSRIICFLTALSSMVPGPKKADEHTFYPLGGVFPHSSFGGIYTCIERDLPEELVKDVQLALDTAREITPEWTLKHDSGYLALSRLFSEAHALTSTDVYQTLTLNSPKIFTDVREALEHALLMKTITLTFYNSTLLEITIRIEQTDYPQRVLDSGVLRALTTDEKDKKRHQKKLVVDIRLSQKLTVTMSTSPKNTRKVSFLAQFTQKIDVSDVWMNWKVRKPLAASTQTAQKATTSASRPRPKRRQGARA